MSSRSLEVSRSSARRRLHGHGVCACAVCDGPLLRNHAVIVGGGGDTAMEEATFLSGIASAVTLVHRRSSFRARGTMQARVLRNATIRVVYNAVVEVILGLDVGEVTGARIRDVSDGTTRELGATGLFVAIGHTPNSASSQAHSS